jgi:hypothetical protein
MLSLAFLLMMQQAPAAPAVQAPPPAAVVQTAPQAAPKPAEVKPEQQVAAPSPAPAAAPAPVAAPASAGPELLQIRNVYVLGMGYQFDQFLANHITRGGVLQVVTDPAKADAVLTDRLGKGFEKKLDELYPPPKVEQPEPPKEEAKEEDRDASAVPSMDIKSAPQERTTSLGRGKGTIFLVSRSTRNVVWSTYERPKTTRPDDLNDTAHAVASQLDSAITKTGKNVATQAEGKKKSGFWPW